MKILMVCLGNICRSPLAEGILQDKSDKLQLHWQIDSAGTGSWHVGRAPHSGSLKVAQKHGLDISHLRARQFQKEDFQRFDKIFVMDANNYNDVKAMAGDLFDEEKIDLILNESFPNENKPVPDPYFPNTSEAFEEVYQLLDKATDKIIEHYSQAQR